MIELGPSSSHDEEGIGALSPSRLVQALSGEGGLCGAEAHLALLLLGPPDDAWLVATQLVRELCRRELHSRDRRSPVRGEEASLLGMLVTAADDLGRPPKMREFDAIACGHPEWKSAATIARRFGSWDRALAEAGLLDLAITAALRHLGGWRQGRRRAEYSRERLIEVLQWCARALHHGALRYVRVQQFNDWRERTRFEAARRGETLDLPCHLHYYKPELFGGWLVACSEAGLSGVPQQARRPAQQSRPGRHGE